MKQWVRVSRSTFINLGVATRVTFASDGHLERAFVHFAAPTGVQDEQHSYIDLVDEEARALKLAMETGATDPLSEEVQHRVG